MASNTSLCTECNEFHGSSANKGLCSTCFQNIYPKLHEEKKIRREARHKPLLDWELSWNAAMSQSDIDTLKSLVQKAIEAERSTSDTDDSLCKRHFGRMSVVFEDSYDKAVSSGSLKIFNSLLCAKAPIRYDQKLLDSLFRRGSGALQIALFDRLLEEDKFSTLVSNEHLEKAMYITGNPENRVLWVERYLIRHRKLCACGSHVDVLCITLSQASRSRIFGIGSAGCHEKVGKIC